MYALSSVLHEVLCLWMCNGKRFLVLVECKLSRLHWLTWNMSRLQVCAILSPWCFPVHMHACTHTHTYAHTLVLSHMHKFILTHTLILSLSHTHTHTCTYTRTALHTNYTHEVYALLPSLITHKAHSTSIRTIFLTQKLVKKKHTGKKVEWNSWVKTPR